MRIVVAGAGLAGLALATGLARDGNEVVVLEADPHADSRPQGYRLHLDGRGLRSLESLLPPESYPVVEATCGRFAETRALQVFTGRLHRIRTIATGPGSVAGRLVSTAVDRSTLRAILADAATKSGAQIHWGTTVLAYDEVGPRVRVRTATAAPDIEADLLVACDGARSRVVAQRLPGLVVTRTGGAIVGRSPASAASAPLTEHLSHGYLVLRGLRGAVGLGLMSFTTPPAQAGHRHGLHLDGKPDYVMWTVGLSERAIPETTSPEALQRRAVRQVRTWHPDVRALLAAADPRDTFLAPALLARRPEPGAASRVTAIGDAVHVMPPDRGSGANLALADAARLTHALREVTDSDDEALFTVIGRAEREMVDQAFAVSESGPTTRRAATAQ